MHYRVHPPFTYANFVVEVGTDDHDVKLQGIYEADQRLVLFHELSIHEYISAEHVLL